ncbi:MAG: hypothetical protein JWO87_126 [Phycisphaerales bacterium]|nr:hypothetical protein [Phycisphaerales bacterium]
MKALWALECSDQNGKHLEVWVALKLAKEMLWGMAAEGEGRKVANHRSARPAGVVTATGLGNAQRTLCRRVAGMAASADVSGYPW